MAVLVEHGGHGGDVAAPVAMEIIDKYFETIAPADREAPHVGLPRRRHNSGDPEGGPAPPREGHRRAEPGTVHAKDVEAPAPAAQEAPAP